MISADELSDVLEDMLAEVLGLEREEITPSARFFNDLGGESIDLLDLDFRIEKHFGHRADLQKLNVADRIQTDESGRLTVHSARALQSQFPSLDVEKLAAAPGGVDLRGLLTVHIITDFVRHRLTEAGALG